MILRPPLKIHGGKYYMVDTLLQILPKHRYYCEVFGGMASLLFNKMPSHLEMYNDVDVSKVKLMNILKTRPDDLQLALSKVTYCKETWEAACRYLGADSDFEFVLNYIIRYRLSRGGTGKSFSDSTRERRGMSEGESAWKSFVQLVPRYSARLQGVMISNESFEQCMVRNLDDPNTFFYLDPPYYPSTRTAPNVYAHELTEMDHEKLAKLCRGARAKILLSGYACSEYDHWFNTWRRIDIPMPNHSGQTTTKERRVETLWCNY